MAFWIISQRDVTEFSCTLLRERDMKEGYGNGTPLSKEAPLGDLERPRWGTWRGPVGGPGEAPLGAWRCVLLPGTLRYSNIWSIFLGPRGY